MMSSFVVEKEYLQHALLFLFHQKKNIDSRRLPIETYGKHALSIRISGNFNVNDSERPGRSQKCEDEKLQ